MNQHIDIDRSYNSSKLILPAIDTLKVVREESSLSAISSSRKFEQKAKDLQGDPEYH